ncbi:hypothetical protein Q1695_001300 [Nippostrongylus brasiliensis]|nr:hypothetical protein Q1695_001300 [Nippostrongylus brasiliensis]
MLRIPESSASASLQLHRAVVHCCVFQSCFLKDRSTDAEIEVQSTPTNKGGIVATYAPPIHRNNLTSSCLSKCHEKQDTNERRDLHGTPGTDKSSKVATGTVRIES